MIKSGKIVPIEKNLLEENSDDIYSDFWERIDSISQSNLDDLFVNNFEIAINPIKSARNILCIITEELISEYIVNLFNDLIEEEQVRVYIVLKEIDKSKQIAKDQLKYLQKLAGKCSIRFIESFSGTLLLVDPNSSSKKGVYFSFGLSDFGELEESDSQFISISFTKTMIDDYFSFFKHCFWERSKTEILNLDMVDIPRVAEKSPNEPLRELNYENLKHNQINNKDLLEFISDFLASNEKQTDLRAYLQYPLTEQIVSQIISNLSLISDKNYLITLKNTGFDSILKKTSKTPNEKIYRTEIPLFFDAIIAGDSGILIVNSPLLVSKSKEWSIVFRLSKKESNKIAKILDWAKKQSNFVFFKEKQLSQIKNVFQYVNSETLETIDHKTARDIEIKDIQTKNIDEFLESINTTPSFSKYKKKNYAKINYKWKILPPKLDPKSEKDLLYNDWSEFSQSFSQKVDYGNEIIINSQICSKNNKVDENLSQFFLAKDITISSLQKELNAINKKNDFASNRRDTLEISQSLDLIIEKLEKQSQAIQNALENSKEIQLKEKEIKDMKKKVDEISNQMARISEEKLEKIKKLEDLSSKYLELKEKLEKTKEKKKKPIIKEIKQINTLIDGFESEIKKYDKKIVDIEREKTSIEENLIQIEKSIKKIQKNLGEREADKSSNNRAMRDFLFFSKKKKQDATKATISKLIDKVPNNVLPEIGVLYSQKKEKYLAITNYDEIEKAKEIAPIYGADIVVDD